MLVFLFITFYQREEDLRRFSLLLSLIELCWPLFIFPHVPRFKISIIKMRSYQSESFLLSFFRLVLQNRVAWRLLLRVARTIRVRSRRSNPPHNNNNNARKLRQPCRDLHCTAVRRRLARWPRAESEFLSSEYTLYFVHSSKAFVPEKTMYTHHRVKFLCRLSTMRYSLFSLFHIILSIVLLNVVYTCM